MGDGETLRFFVTLEPRFQRLAESHLRDLEGAIPPEYEAGAVMMTSDGRVRAMIGSTDWSKPQFNAAVKSNVQPGSTAKLPLLVAACEAGKKPESRVIDLPVPRDDGQPAGEAAYASRGMAAFSGRRNRRLRFDYGFRLRLTVGAAQLANPTSNGAC